VEKQKITIPESRLLQPKILQETPMQAELPRPEFEHRSVTSMPERIASYCAACHEFIGVSPKPTVLRIAERAHICPVAKRKQAA
jgi:hypothetical protein